MPFVSPISTKKKEDKKINSQGKEKNFYSKLEGKEKKN
jgi:hypothetical protein